MRYYTQHAVLYKHETNAERKQAEAAATKGLLSRMVRQSTTEAEN